MAESTFAVRTPSGGGVKVTLNLYATLRKAVGQKAVEVSLPLGATVLDLLDEVIELHPTLGPLLLDEKGEYSRLVHVFVNGRSAIHLPNRLRTRLRLTDHLDLFPAVAGGK